MAKQYYCFRCEDKGKKKKVAKGNRCLCPECVKYASGIDWNTYTLIVDNSKEE